MSPAPHHARRWFAVLLLLLTVTAEAANYSGIGSKLAEIVNHELREWEIGGVSIALVEDQEIVYSAGFGEAKADSIYRVGSISKLFNAIAVMQQVEEGKLSLDAPLPAEVAPVNPFPGQPAVTLRQLLSHRSGLTREPMVGGYLDTSEPGLAATVASVAPSVLVTKPGEKTRYSNIGPSVAGWMVEQATGNSFEQYQQKRILGPLQMTNSAWTIKGLNRKKVIISHIRVADGRGGWKRQECPLFDLGTIPAGNLFSTAPDLARFASALIAGGSPILRKETLDEMWRPQLTTEPAGFGLGFVVGKFRQHRTVSHSGAVYGHSTSIVILPEQKIAAIVLANEDIANGRVRRISQAALSMMLEVNGETSPAAVVGGSDLAPFAGDYESQSYWARLSVADGRITGNISGQETKFTPAGGLAFKAHSRLEDATPVAFIRGDGGSITGFAMGAQRFERVSANPAPLPAEWRAVLGSYGPKLIPLIITERYGHLYVMTENMVDYRLTPINRHSCLLPPGMYVDEQVVFMQDKRGRIERVNFANMMFERR